MRRTASPSSRPSGTPVPARGERGWAEGCRAYSLERCLDLLRVLQMRDEGGSHLHQQRLELLVLGARDQRLVHRVEHRLVIRDLVVDVGLVEVLALLQSAQVREVVAPALREAAAG